jgi:dTDP-4-amino-4,6-dideoxygalactose transaminase
VSSPSSYTIPIIDLRAQYSTVRSEIRRAIDGVLETQQLILGPAVKQFEEKMAGFLQSRFAVAVASGSDALLLALMALDTGPGDAVIVTPFTFFSTVSAITRLGAKPLFVDIDPQSHLASANNVARFLEEHARIKNGTPVDSMTGCAIKALLPVHLFGQCCAMNEFVSIAKNYRLQVVEDVAQACGARTVIDGHTKFAGTIGNLGCFSFFPSKTLGAYGDGGLIATEDEELAAKITMLRMHGESTKYIHQSSGINSRLDSIQAAVLSVKQRYLEDWCEQRIQKAQAYHHLFAASGVIDHGRLGIPALVTDKSHVFNNYVVRAERRDDLKSFLAAEGIQSEIYYPLPLHLQPCFAELGYKKGDFPQAELAASQVLALPIYPELTTEQQEIVVNKIKEFYR